MLGVCRPVTTFVFWCEAGAISGVGHLFRCMALAQAAREQGVDSHFLLTLEAAKIAKAQHEWDFPISQYSDKSSAEEALTLLLSKDNTNVLVVDGYHIPIDTVNEIKGYATCVVALDDGEKRFVDVANVVVNPAATPELYASEASQAVLCMGEGYRLLRQSFSSLTPLSIERRHGIVICFGGSDPARLTVPLLKSIDQLTQDIPVRVITGAANPEHEKVASLCNTLSYPVQHIHDCQDMAQAWSSAKLAISAAGGSQFELGVCQTPSLLVTVADNQIAASNKAATEDWCHVVDKSVGVDEIAAKALALYNDEAKLSAMQQAAMGLYDPLGAFRLLEVIAGVIRDNNR